MAPKTKEQFEEIRQQSKAAIKKAALELFARKGFAGSSISEIAGDAGISKGLMYNYFDSKEKLLQEILLDAVESTREAMAPFQTKEGDPSDKLKRMIESLFSIIQGNLHHWKLLTAIAFQPGALEGLEDTLQDIKENTLQLMIHMLAALGAEDPEKEAFFFGATLDGILLHYMTMEETYPLEDMKLLLIERFCSPRRKN